MPNTKSSLPAYVSDMLALEHHTLQPLQWQLEDSKAQKFPAAIKVITEMRDSVQQHITALERQLEQLGGKADHPIKEALASAAGAAAGALNKVREHAVSKMLRDDYTATTLRSISYTMLYTTALAEGDQGTAAIALRHLNEVNPQIISISKVIPGVVVREIAEADERVFEPGVAEKAVEETQKAWNNPTAR